MAFLKFLLICFLLLIVAGMVRVGLWMWSIRRTLRDAQDAARRMYGDGPYARRDEPRKPQPTGEYADYEEIDEPIAAPVQPTDDDLASTPTTQVIDAKYEELP